MTDEEFARIKHIDPWWMLCRDTPKDIDLNRVAVEMASLMSCAAMPFQFDRDRIEDANGNELIASEFLPIVNSVPAMLLEIRRLRDSCKARTPDEILGEFQDELLKDKREKNSSG